MCNASLHSSISLTHCENCLKNTDDAIDTKWCKISSLGIDARDFIDNASLRKCYMFSTYNLGTKSSSNTNDVTNDEKYVVIS